MPDLFDLGVSSSAVLSPCGLYRYSLTRTWDEALPTVTFCMLNPSVADAEQDDPTIRRCLGFARAWGCGSLAVVNLFAYRATYPRELRKVKDPVGPDNDAAILRHAGSGLTVAAWGAQPFAQGRIRRVLDLLHLAGARLHCLKLTKGGYPWHPLFCRADLKAVEYRP